MRRTIELALLTTACLQLASINPLFAQDIVELNQQGVEAYSEGRFEEAAQKFNAAYAIKPEAPLKKNEAVAWFKANKCSEALAAAKEYLALGVENDLSKQEAQTVIVKCYLQRADTEFAAGNLDGATSALGDAKASSPTPEDAQAITKLEEQIQAKRDAAENEKRAALAAAQAEEDQKARDEKRDKTKMIGLGVAGTGAAIVVGTLIYHITLATGTSSKFKDAAAAGDRAEYDRLGKRLETGNWLVPTLYAVGVATAGLGGYLWWSTGANDTAAPMSASLGGLESVGATVTWTF